MADLNPNDTLEERFKDIVSDLFNIEVNTILKKSISGQKMPSVRHALIDIGEDYYNVLEELQTAIEPKEFIEIRHQFGFYTEEERKLPDDTSNKKMVKLAVSPDIEDQPGGFAAFDIIQMWANVLLKEKDEQKRKCLEKKPDYCLLPRIKENSDMLKGMFSAMCLHDKTLKDELTKELEKSRSSPVSPEANIVVALSDTINPQQTSYLTNQLSRSEIISNKTIPSLSLSMNDSDVLLVRKIWEIGTEVIAIQTTIQLDGDVILRLNPNCMDEHPELLSVHNEGVRVALSYWQNLITIAKEFVVSLGRGVFNKL